MNMVNKKHLQELIYNFENQQIADKIEMNNAFNVVVEKIKPFNILKSTLLDINNLPGLKNNLLDTTLGVAAGFLTKKVVLGKAQNPVKEMIGTLVQIGVTSLLSKHSNGLKSIGTIIFNGLFKKRTPTPDQEIKPISNEK